MVRRSSPSLEVGFVIITRFGNDGMDRLRSMIVALGVDVVPFTPSQAEHAVDAYRRFGKGRDPARLNMGDCCSYAPARSFDEPLSFKGSDYP